MEKRLLKVILVSFLLILVSNTYARHNVSYYYNLNVPGDPGYYPGYYDYCRYHRPHREGRRCVAGRCVCYSDGYGYCHWVPPHWEGSYLVPAHRVCW